MAAETSKLKVFLCHSKDDKSKIRKLYKRLIVDGFDAWLDEENLMPGQDWDLEIKKAVRNSDTVIVCLSNSSTTKEGYIQKEIRFALDIADEKPEGTIFLIPIRLDECKVPTRINRYQWVDLFEKTGYGKLKESLHLRMDDLNIRFDSDKLLLNSREDTVKIPILGSISADTLILVPEPGKDYLAGKEFISVEINKSLIPTDETANDWYALEVAGNGMRDAMISDGDIVVFKFAEEAHNGEMVGIRLGDEYILRYFYIEEDRYRLQPANPEIRPIYVSKNVPLEINGKVVMVIRQTKLIK